MAAQTLCDSIDGEGEIVVINWSTLQAVRERVEGLKSVIEESYPNVEIVADQDAFGVVEDAQSIMESFLQTYPDVKESLQSTLRQHRCSGSNQGSRSGRQDFCSRYRWCTE